MHWNLQKMKNLVMKFHKIKIRWTTRYIKVFKQRIQKLRLIDIAFPMGKLLAHIKVKQASLN